MNSAKSANKEKLIDVKKVLSIIQKNFIVLSRDRTRLIMLTMFPLIMILIFGFTSGNMPKHIPTAIVAYDSSPLSEKIMQAFGSSQVLSIKSMVSTEGEAKNLLDRGIVKVVIEIPPGIEQAISSGGTAQITVMVDESDSSIAGTARSVISSIVSELSRQMGAQRIAYFQQSVSAASRTLQSSSAVSSGAEFSIIIANADAALGVLSAVDAAIEAGGLAMENSLPSTKLITFGSTNGSNKLVNESQVVAPPGYAAAKAQIEANKAESAMLKSAMAGIQSIGSVAEQGKSQADTLADYENQRKITDAVNQISRFAYADVNAEIQPLSYGEKQAYGTGRKIVDFLIPAIIALTIFQGAVMGMGRAIAGEKKEGSLTRVFLTPTSNVTIILGTVIFYVIFELFRSSFMMIFATTIFHIRIEGSLLSLGLVMMIFAAVSTCIGLFFSALVKSEQQYMAMSMLVSMPTIFLSGAFLPVQAMPAALQKLAAALPITYAADAFRAIMIKGLPLAAIGKDIAILLIFLAVTLGAVFLTFRRDLE